MNSRGFPGSPYANSSPFSPRGSPQSGNSRFLNPYTPRYQPYRNGGDSRSGGNGPEFDSNRSFTSYDNSPQCSTPKSGNASSGNEPDSSLNFSSNWTPKWRNDSPQSFRGRGFRRNNNFRPSYSSNNSSHFSDGSPSSFNKSNITAYVKQSMLIDPWEELLKEENK